MQQSRLKDKFERKINESISWNDKKGRASRFNKFNSNYRLWKPEISNTPNGGVFLIMKMDHIRGSAKDDYATIKVTFNKYRQVVDLSFQIKLADDSVYTKSLSDITATAKSVVKSTSKDPRALAATEAADAVANLTGSIYGKAVGAMADRGGRQNFSNIINLQTCDIIEIMKDIK